MKTDEKRFMTPMDNFKSNIKIGLNNECSIAGIAAVPTLSPHNGPVKLLTAREYDFNSQDDIDKQKLDKIKKIGYNGDIESITEAQAIFIAHYVEESIKNEYDKLLSSRKMKAQKIKDSFASNIYSAMKDDEERLEKLKSNKEEKESAGEMLEVAIEKKL